MTTKIHTLLLCGLIASLGCVTQAQAQKYRVVDLGLGEASGIANEGSVAGILRNDTGLHAAIWSRAGQVTVLGELPGDKEGQATQINDSGLVVGHSYYYRFANQYQYTVSTAFSWTAETGLRKLPWLEAENGLVLPALNNLGHMAGNGARDPDGSKRPYFWRPDTGITFIPAPPGLPVFGVGAMNDQDQVVGGGGDGQGPWMGFVWSPAASPVILKSPLRTYPDLSPGTINASGRVAGILTDAKGHSKLFSWTAKGGVTVLTPLVSYTGVIRTLNVDNNNRIIGNRGNVGFVWTLFGGLKDINTLLVDNGTVKAPIAQIFDITGVNISGQITARAVIGGQPHAVRLDPVR